MATFVARVRDINGNLKRQEIKAANLREARGRLRERGFTVEDLKMSQPFSLERLKNIDLDDIAKMMESIFSKVTIKDKAVFSRQFAAMVNAGVAMVRSLGVLSEQCSNPKLKKALQAVSADVQEGSGLSESMRKHPACFDYMYVSMVQAGETGGVLDDVLNRLAKLLEDNARLQNQIKSALTYPVVVLFLAVGIFIAMTVFVLPTFEKIFDSLNVELPMFTQIMMGISKFLRTPQYVAMIMLILGALSFAFKTYYKTRIGRETVDRYSLKVPLFGDLIQKTATARFCRTFGALTKSGVPILQALEIVRDTAGNQIIANAIDESRREIQVGGMISLALQKERVFPNMAIQMISIGEETGELDKMLAKVADFYENEVEEAVKAMTSIIEPIMIVVLGGMVGSILVSMYLPMFKVFDKLG
jgi:type IV pilus assembly protein PilC